MEKILERFEIKHLQVLDENGKTDSKLMPRLTNIQIKKMYELMVLSRVFDDKALKMQRQGRMGTYAPIKGQEASQIGSGLALSKEDFVFPAFREEGTYLARGMPAHMIYQYWGGDERGMSIPKEVGMFTISITVGAHLPHAAGAGMAYKILKKKGAVMTYFGDGATSEGDFHEAMNFAGAFKVPVVFICQNNQWAISVPVKEQTAAKTIAQKAIAYGFEGIRIDGNDIFAVYKATHDALKKARAGKGPTLIECLTYRMADHTTSDDAKKYRKESELRAWVKKDPITRLEKYMKNKKISSEKEMKKVWEDAQKKIDEEANKYLAIENDGIEAVFNCMYAELPPELIEQRENAKRYDTRHGQADSKEPAKKTASPGQGAKAVGELEEAPEESEEENENKTNAKKTRGGK